MAGPVSEDGWVLEVDDRTNPTELILRREGTSGARPRRVPYTRPDTGQVTRLVDAGVPWPYANALVRQLATELIGSPRHRAHR